MINLEKLVCSAISDGAREVYAGLANNNNDEGRERYVNTSFQLDLKPEEDLNRSLRDLFEIHSLQKSIY